MEAPEPVSGCIDGDVRVLPSIDGAAIIVECFGPRGGFRGRSCLPTALAPALHGAIDWAVAEALQIELACALPEPPPLEPIANLDERRGPMPSDSWPSVGRRRHGVS